MVAARSKTGDEFVKNLQDLSNKAHVLEQQIQKAGPGNYNHGLVRSQPYSTSL